MGATGYGALIGAALGLVKGSTVDKDKERRQRELEVIKAKYSPWTGMTPSAIQEADPWGSAFQGGTAGAGMGQSIGSANDQSAYQGEQLKLQKRQMASEQKANDALARYYNTQNALDYQSQPKQRPPGQS